MKKESISCKKCCNAGRKKGIEMKAYESNDQEKTKVTLMAAWMKNNHEF